MRLRNLMQKDAPLMLEWMHDPDVTEKLAGNFAAKQLSDCENFIKASADTSENLHLAIVSDEDEYMGTVSLKQIDRQAKNAEFAITVRKAAMRKGYSWYGMEEIIRLAFEEQGLESVYWCVAEENIRACKFYDKHGFRRVTDMPEAVLARYGNRTDLRWYCVAKGDHISDTATVGTEVPGGRIISIKTIPTGGAGVLSFFEATRDISFEIKRIYYISQVPEGARRGFHAHKELKQLLFCPYGKIRLLLDDGKQRREITLNDPSVGVVIDKLVWREMIWQQSDSVLCVAVSDFYTEDDYIRDYDAFLQYASQH